MTESDMGYSFSCGTGGSVSSLEFMDTGIPTQPNSPGEPRRAGYLEREGGRKTPKK
jgi:hypothetical protein